jgi:D-tyrosyl-tRNA(Tyr) deacylase
MQPHGALTAGPFSVKVTPVRAVVQRVLSARVTVEGAAVGEIGPGLLVLLGVKDGDGEDAARYVAEKIANLRIMPDEQGRMDRSVLEAGGEVLLVSQFTLYGDARKGRRPSYTAAAGGPLAVERYGQVRDLLRAAGLRVETGEFGADMRVEMAGHGPVTILLDSDKQF